MKQVVLLGATGSIGQTTLDVLRDYPKFKLLGSAVKQQGEALAKIAHEFQTSHAVIYDENAYQQARSFFSSQIQLSCQLEGLIQLATLPQADIVVVAMTGTIGLLPTIAALKAGKTVALASKEVLISGHPWIQEALKTPKSRLLPIDSEHNAIFQCLQGDSDEQIHKVIITASGGPFLRTPLAAFHTITPKQALCHPRWEMGPKNTIDSATLANKGLEYIEAAYLFNLAPEQLEVLIHLESIVHGMVQWSDGNLIAQLSPTSMAFPIAYCLHYPQRNFAKKAQLDLGYLTSLHFETPDLIRFPCLKLAQEALVKGNSAPILFTLADEIAVEAFLAHEISFINIPKLIDWTLNHFSSEKLQSLDELFSFEKQTRAKIKEAVVRYQR